MKRQIGVRVDSRLWDGFKQLCSQACLRPTEALEAFFKACLAHGSVSSILKMLESMDGDKVAAELKVRKLLTELYAYLAYDKKHGSTKYCFDISTMIDVFRDFLPKICNNDLLREIKKAVEEALAYYNSVFERAEFPPDKLF